MRLLFDPNINFNRHDIYNKNQNQNVIIFIQNYKIFSYNCLWVKTNIYFYQTSKVFPPRN